MTLEMAAPAWAPLRPGLLERDPNGGVTLAGNRCSTCGTTYFPALKLCLTCFSEAGLAPLPLSRRGSLYAWTVVYQSTPEFQTPYVLAYVDLPEGVRVLAQVEVAPEAARTGLPVEIVPATVKPAADDAPEVIGYRFRPIEEARS
ncbi:MAG: OB-fold domain-containing protein [Chloroflexota bacterium]|nr:OB-fold domain-containing protein [Chloroflexota bacterium]